VSLQLGVEGGGAVVLVRHHAKAVVEVDSGAAEAVVDRIGDDPAAAAGEAQNAV